MKQGYQEAEFDGNQEEARLRTSSATSTSAAERCSGGCGSTTRSLSISTRVVAVVLQCHVDQVKTLLPNPFLLINLI